MNCKIKKKHLRFWKQGNKIKRKKNFINFFFNFCLKLLNVNKITEFTFQDDDAERERGDRTLLGLDGNVMSELRTKKGGMDG